MAVVQQQISCLAHCYWEQAPSHRDLCCWGKCHTHKNARHNRAFCIDLLSERGK